MASLPKLSSASILLHVAGHTTADNYALAICKATGYASGSVVPALARMTERDGLMTRSDQPTTTGKPRRIYTLTDKGWTEVKQLVTAFAPRVAVLANAGGSAQPLTVKVNTSTVWLLAAAALTGRTYGYIEAMRPLTHQAAYVELERLTAAGWFVAVDGEHALTDEGRNAAVSLHAFWTPVLERASTGVEQWKTRRP